MNDNIKDIVVGLLINASYEDIEKLSVAIIKECAILNDKWVDSGEHETFGKRLKAHFGVE